MLHNTSPSANRGYLEITCWWEQTEKIWEAFHYCCTGQMRPLVNFKLVQIILLHTTSNKFCEYEMFIFYLLLADLIACIIEKTSCRIRSQLLFVQLFLTYYHKSLFFLKNKYSSLRYSSNKSYFSLFLESLGHNFHGLTPHLLPKSQGRAQVRFWPVGTMS